MRNHLINREILLDELEKYGFEKNKNKYIFEQILSNPNFKAKFEYYDHDLTSKVTDLESNEEYILVDVLPIGKYASEIKIEYEKLITDIIEKCTKKDIFKNPQSKRAMEYIEDKYNSKLEFLWKKFPNYAIYRNKENRKWFAVLMKVEKSKIGLEGNEIIEIINLKNENVNKIINNKFILKGFHMNKKYWVSIILKDNLDDEELFNHIDTSYNLISK